MGNNETIIIQGAQIIYKNFSGKIDEYNKNGDVHFCVVVNEIVRQQLIDLGVVVKSSKYGDSHYIKVGVNKNSIYSTSVVLVQNNALRRLKQEEYGILDSIDISTADVEIRLYSWNNNIGSGVKPYLKTLYAIERPDPFYEKYSNTDNN